jgi:uncharacterized protein YdiU (UPF0061 family)
VLAGNRPWPGDAARATVYAGELQRLARVLERPYDEQPHAARYARAAAADEPVAEVSCSS